MTRRSAPLDEGRVPFVWPPRRIPDDPAPSAQAVPARRELGRWSEALESLERTLLPWVSPPLAWRLATGQVELDESGAACDRCGRTLQAGEDREFGCVACEGERLPWTRLVRLGEYRDGLAEAVREVKFRGNRVLGAGLGALLGQALLRAGAAARPTALAPVPTTLPRRLTLGLDHALTLARGAGRAAGLPVVAALRRRPGPTQLEVAPSARARNVAGVFRVRVSRVGRLPQRVVVVDDVLTTGSTLRSACRALQRAAPGVELWAAVAAAAPQRG